MLHRLTRSTSIVSCTFRARLSLKVQRKPCWQGVGNSTLTTRSEAVCITDLDTVLSICDQEQRETLRNVSAAACKAIKGCCANKDLSEEKLVSLLLRVAALRYLWQQQYRHDTQKLDDISCMIERVAALTDVLAGGSSEQTLQAIE